MERPELPDVDRILEMKLKDLMKLCKDLNVDCRGFRTATQFQEAVFDYMKQYATLHQAPPPFVTTAADLFRTFARKRLEVLTIVDSVKDFVSSEDVKPWLEKLHVDQFDCWMTPKMFEETKEAVTRGTPTLLVAGPTSAGKSTLLNALLGEQVLPTSYNATTSALCEIKYSQTPGKKYAVVHLNTGESEYSTIELDLTAEEGRIQFAEYVYANREQLAQESNIDGDEAIPVCTRAEIYWPEEFLKHFTLVDSPGVTEQEGDSVARQLTERFQTDLACGFIYVVDGTRSAEEAAQVGGLLLAVSKGTGSLPPSNSALFVINKWDLASQQMRKDERQEFLSKLEMQVSSRWTGLKPQQQLITMNAKLAVRAQQLGSSTADMKRLCKSIEQLLPKGMDHMLLQGLRSIQSLLDRIEQSTESTLRLLELPMEERMKKYESDWNKLESFRREDGTYGKQIHELQGMVNRQIRKLVRDLWSDLKLGKGKDTILMFKNDHMRDWERTVYDAREVQTLVEGRVTSAILQHEGFEEFIQWAASEIKKPVEYLLAQLQVFGAEVTSFNPSTVDTSWADCLTDDKKGWKPTQVAKAVAVGAMAVAAAPVALVLGLIAIPVYKAVQAVGNMTFKKTYTKAYGEFLDRACQDDYKELQTIITDLLGRSCEPVKMLHFDIPRCIGELKRELETRAKQEEEFKGDYKSMLELCRARKKKIAEFVLNLNIHDYAEDEIQWPNPLRPEATGSFGKVFKVTVPEKGTSAIKLMTEAVNEENAEEYLKELNVCRQFKHPNVVAFYGSVSVSDPDGQEPPRIGLIFEWCGGGTLLDEISNRRLPSPAKPQGVQRGLEVIMQMASGLKFLHSRKVVHRDLKPENVMMTDSKVVKLGDMGLAKSVDQVTGTFCGTILYMAPEVLVTKPYGPSADMFSIGIIMWEIWSKRRAYTDVFSMNVGIHGFIELVSKGEIRPGQFDKPVAAPPGGINMKAIADHYKNWAKTCWDSDPTKRLTAEQLQVKVKQVLDDHVYVAA